VDLKLRLFDLLERAYQEEQVFVQGLSDEERSAGGTPEQWSAKDMIAHIAAWKERAAQVLAALRSGEPGPGFDGLDRINARIFEEHQNPTWSDVLSRSAQRYGFPREQTGATPDGVLIAPEESDLQDEPVWWFVVGAGYNHSLGHLAEYYIGRGDTTYAIEMQEEAAEHLLPLDEGSEWQGRVHYGLAIYYAAAGQTGKAIDALRRACRLHPALVERAKQDSRLASIQENSEYHRLQIE
jgi:tetratricopeptide (TPR) repeat protein